MRETSQRIGLLEAVGQLVVDHGLPTATLTYNAPVPHIAAGQFLQRCGSPWIPLIADVPEAETERPIHDEAIRKAAGRVYFSYESWRTSDATPKLHLDGGVTAADATLSGTTSERALLYSGALNKYAGIALLLEAFSRMEDIDVQLWICGKGEAGPIEEAARKDSRITFFGPVSDSRLRELSSKAWAFVNPRSMVQSANRHNFPSKILEYLAYGKPVVSAWTLGLAPEYRELLYTYSDETPQALLDVLRAVLDLGSAEREALQERTRRFLQTRKLWSAQAGRLVHWIEAEVLAHG